MGNSKKFYRNKRRASKSHKNKAAATAFVSEEKTNDDSNDLEAFAALMNSIADAYGVSKCEVKAAHNLESSPPVGISNSPGIFIPKRDTGAEYDDQTPHATESSKMGNSKKFYRNKRRASERQRNKNKAAGTSAFVSEEKANDDSHDLEAFVALMDSIADTYGVSKCGAAHNSESSPPVRIPSSPGVFISKRKRDTGAEYDDQTPRATESCNSHMDTLGVSVVYTVEGSKYELPVKNSAGNLENWVGIPGVYIRKREIRAGCDNQTALATASAGKVENWAASGNPYIF